MPHPAFLAASLRWTLAYVFVDDWKGRYLGVPLRVSNRNCSKSHVFSKYNLSFSAYIGKYIDQEIVKLEILDIPAGELGVDELQLEVFEDESKMCIEGLYPTPAWPAGPLSEARNVGSFGNLVGKIGDPSLVSWLI